MWLAKEDVARVTNEITAHIPGEFDCATNKFLEPEDERERRLQKLVSAYNYFNPELLIVYNVSSVLYILYITGIDETITHLQ